MRLLHARPQLASWWAGLEAARFLVGSRLRSPYGGPSHTFEALERFLLEAVAAHQAEAAAAAAAAAATAAGTGGVAARGSATPATAPAAAAARPRQSLALLLHTIEQLERHVANAYDGSPALPPPPRQARSFFITNRRVCIDWFARIRTHLLRAALYSRAPASVVRHAQLRLVELAARAAQLCTRADGGRLLRTLSLTLTRTRTRARTRWSTRPNPNTLTLTHQVAGWS